MSGDSVLETGIQYNLGHSQVSCLTPSTAGPLSSLPAWCGYPKYSRYSNNRTLRFWYLIPLYVPARVSWLDNAKNIGEATSVIIVVGSILLLQIKFALKDLKVQAIKTTLVWCYFTETAFYFSVSQNFVSSFLYHSFSWNWQSLERVLKLFVSDFISRKTQLQNWPSCR